MGGKIVNPAAIVRPWNEGWQTWSRARGPEGWSCHAASEIVEVRDSGRVICAIPARLAISACFWIESIEGEIVKEMSSLEMEVRGVASRDRIDCDTCVHILFREESRTFVRAVVFPPDWPDELKNLKGGQYEPSPCVAVLADQSVHLWREGDDLVAAVTWRGKLICWETMHWILDARQIGNWLRCFLLQLRSEAGISEDFLLRSWNSAIALPEGFSVGPASSAQDLSEGPMVQLTESACAWLPPVRRLAEEVGRRRRSTLFLLAAVGLLIAAAAGIAAFSYWNVIREIQTLNAQIAQSEIDALPIRQVAERWARIGPAVDQRYYPIELLFHIVSAIPSSVRLTVFEMTPESVLIEGEAKNVSAATEFLARIQKSEEMHSLAWEMPPPSLQANNTARFVINGIRTDAEQ